MHASRADSILANAAQVRARRAYMAEREIAAAAVRKEAERLDFVTQRLDALPRRWREPLRQKWGALLDQGQSIADAWLRKATQPYVEQRLPLSLTDADVCEIAQRNAMRATVINMDAGTHPWPLRRVLVERYVKGEGVEPPAETIGDKGAVLRMCCPMWWRRRLRAAVGRAMEAEAIRLGRVHAAAECYASDETVQARVMQNARNAAALESTIATNENGDEYTLAELAAKGTANKAIRRGELMTRIKGFETVGAGLGSACWFLTLTCPSKYHRRTRSARGRVGAENPKWDGFTPRDAQSYLCKVWARIRSAWKRQGVDVFGFRIAEPHHDGCPHWHLLIWCEPKRNADMLRAFRFHAFQEDGDEEGAAKYRVKVVPVLGSKGGAVAYVAKYIAKNIDGYQVGEDLYGNPALDSSMRVEAWAARWGIRQFQQIGGPPVGVWRELRRIEAEKLADAPADLKAAHEAAQRDGERLADWARYCHAQGMGRRYVVAKAWSDEPGRYDEAIGNKPFGVTDGADVWQSTRHVWEIRRAGNVGKAGKVHSLRGVLRQGEREGAVALPQVSGLNFASGARRRAEGQPKPRTRVNNCTRDKSESAGKAQGDAVLGALVQVLNAGIVDRAQVIAAMHEREERKRNEKGALPWTSNKKTSFNWLQT